MPTKYVQVKGAAPTAGVAGEDPQAVHYFYAGATTTPDVIPDFSRGRAVVFVHAAGSNGHSWYNQVDHLATQHSPVALDLPGHGRSDGVRGCATVAEYTDFLTAFLDALKLTRVVIVGRSMGGAIAMNFAIHHPERVQGLIGIATAARFTLPPALLSGLEAVAKGRATDQYTNNGYSPRTVAENFEIVREGWREQAKTDPIVRYGDVKACQQVDLRAELGRIKAPTLVIAGADDQVTPPSDAQFIAGQIAGSRLVVLESAAHNVPTEQAAAVNAEIGTFLGQL